ncbi:MAG: hypothetical protein ABIN97_04185 [Ginsengibacter sp.]
MKSYYTAYTKIINGETFYFVKHFQTFPEYNDVQPFLESYAMHTDFYKACKIAGVSDKTIQLQLSEKVGIINTYRAESTNVEAKIIQMKHKSPVYNFKNWQISLPGLLKLVNLR